MTPKKAYELAKMFADREMIHCLAIANMERDRNLPQSDTPAARREAQDRERVSIEIAAMRAELRLIERRVMGILDLYGEQHDNQD